MYLSYVALNCCLHFYMRQPLVNYWVMLHALVLHLQVTFTDYIGTPLSSRRVSSRAGNPANTVSYRLKTLSLPVFNYYRHLLPVVLAHLVMGDGNYQADAKTIRVYTNGFTQDELNMFAKAIQAKYSIDVGVRHDRKGQTPISYPFQKFGGRNSRSTSENVHTLDFPAQEETKTMVHTTQQRNSAIYPQKGQWSP